MAQTEREQALETLRQKALQDSDALGSRQRFALFSQPPPLAVGDDFNQEICQLKHLNREKVKVLSSHYQDLLQLVILTLSQIESSANMNYKRKS